MTPSLIFLIALLAVVVALNWRALAVRLGWRVKACDWHRVSGRDREGAKGPVKAWFCPACGREELVEGAGPPPDCGARIGR